MNEYGEVHAWRACEIITIYTHGISYFFKTMKNIGNTTYQMHDTPMTSVDKKNSLFKMKESVYTYKVVILEGKNYKVKLFQLTNVRNPASIHFYSERIVDKNVIEVVLTEHYKSLNLAAIDPFCYND